MEKFNFDSQEYRNSIAKELRGERNKEDNLLRRVTGFTHKKKAEKMLEKAQETEEYQSAKESHQTERNESIEKKHSVVNEIMDVFPDLDLDALSKQSAKFPEILDDLVIAAEEVKKLREEKSEALSKYPENIDSKIQDIKLKMGDIDVYAESVAEKYGLRKRNDKYGYRELKRTTSIHEDPMFLNFPLAKALAQEEFLKAPELTEYIKMARPQDADEERNEYLARINKVREFVKSEEFINIARRYNQEERALLLGSLDQLDIGDDSRDKNYLSEYGLNDILESYVSEGDYFYIPTAKFWEDAIDNYIRNHSEIAKPTEEEKVMLGEQLKKFIEEKESKEKEESEFNSKINEQENQVKIIKNSLNLLNEGEVENYLEAKLSTEFKNLLPELRRKFASNHNGPISERYDIERYKVIDNSEYLAMILDRDYEDNIAYQNYSFIAIADKKGNIIDNRIGYGKYYDSKDKVKNEGNRYKTIDSALVKDGKIIISVTAEDGSNKTFEEEIPS